MSVLILNYSLHFRFCIAAECPSTTPFELVLGYFILFCDIVLLCNCIVPGTTLFCYWLCSCIAINNVLNALSSFRA